MSGRRDGADSSPVAVVTGGARRLGRHLCTTLAARNFDVVILYRDSEAEARSLEQQIVATGDPGKAHAIEAAARHAGGGAVGPILNKAAGQGIEQVRL